ncbi:hypothetical protein ABQE44_25430 [Mycolicibacterium sp. XJ2546]
MAQPPTPAWTRWWSKAWRAAGTSLASLELLPVSEIVQRTWKGIDAALAAAHTRAGT